MVLSAMYCVLITLLCRGSALFIVIKICLNINYAFLNGKCLWNILSNSRWEYATPWISSTGGFRLYLLPSSGTVQSCSILLSMLFSFTHSFCVILVLLTPTFVCKCVSNNRECCGTTAGTDSHTQRVSRVQPKHHLLIFISSLLGSQVRKA